MKRRIVESKQRVRDRERAARPREAVGYMGPFNGYDSGTLIPQGWYPVVTATWPPGMQVYDSYGRRWPEA